MRRQEPPRGYNAPTPTSQRGPDPCTHSVTAGQGFPAGGRLSLTLTPQPWVNAADPRESLLGSPVLLTYRKSKSDFQGEGEGNVLSRV